MTRSVVRIQFWIVPCPVFACLLVARLEAFPLPRWDIPSLRRLLNACIEHHDDPRTLQGDVNAVGVVVMSESDFSDAREFGMQRLTQLSR